MKRVKPLTAKTLERWRPREAREELVDGAVPGLRVRRSPGGALMWSLLARVDGRLRRVAIGEHLSLSAARKLAVDARRKISTGVDPTAERRTRRKRTEDAAAGLGTLGSIVKAYFENGDGKALRTRRMQRTMVAAVWRELMSRPAMSMRMAELQLAANNYKSASSSARAIGYMRPIIRWAVGLDLMAGDADALRAPVQAAAEQRVLSGEELGPFLRALGSDGHSVAARFILMTAVRRSEACSATWGDIDIENSLWTIPAAKRKDTRPARARARENGGDHVVPLSRQANALLRFIGPGKAEDLVFVGQRGASLGNWTTWCRRVETKLRFRFTIHSLRRTCATLAGDVGAEPHVISALLGHRIGGSLLARYAKSKYLPEVANALQLIADRLDALEVGGNVVALPRRA
jgi:integrase